VKRRAFLGALGAGLAGRPALHLRRTGDVLVERWSWVMGQAAHVVVFAGSEAEGLDACAAALAELRRVEARLSLFDDRSDLCELNRRAGRVGGRSMPVDRDLREVLRLAAGYRHLTAGAFDVAVEPLMRVWGFHRPRRSPPTAAEVAEAREAVAHARVQLDGDRALLATAHTQLDLGGIGVGYGLDRAAAVLRGRGVTRAFLDVSGDCAALGAPPGEPGWRVAVVDPRRPGAELRELRLRDAALATSANTVSVVRFGDAVRGHVMDPATGRPAAALLQATVVARRAVTADALSTAMLVSGVRPAGAVDALAVAG
jgi:FAD:protein FMN transferase